MMKMFKKKDGDPKKALMAKPAKSTKTVKVMKSKLTATPKVKSIPFPVKEVKSYDMKTGLKKK